jgi:signal transduction histidine kinase
MSIYSRLASLKMVREADKAWEWNEKFGALCKHFPDYYKVYLALKGGISFFREDRRTFLKTYDEFQQFIKEHADLDEYGVGTMKICHTAFNGQYDEALELLKTTNQDFDALKNFDFRIKIYEMMGNEHLAVSEANKRRDYRDSLNSDMLYNNISQVNAELNVAKINQQAAEERELWMVIVILLLLGIIAVSMAWSIWYRRINQQLKKQNQDLESALDRAEESDRMKSAFIEQVSHEIRTPLNVITGFAQIITNPSYQLNEKERDEMLNAISKNTHEITNIVNELLEVAQDESRNQYDKEDNIVCEELCNQVMDEAHRLNNGRLELQYVNEVPKDFTFKSNRKVMEKILNQLMDNAMKFTEKGSVELRSAYNAPLHTLAFIITDTGIGIPKEEHPNIFHRFFKIDQFKQGLGLGLTMCKKMADLLGYQLYIDSNYTAGCKMVLKFEV